LTGSPDPAGPTRVALLGSTGSIGRQTLDVLSALGPREFEVVALAAGHDAATLSQQVSRSRPSIAILADPSSRGALDVPRGTRVELGEPALTDVATRDDVDLVIVATGGVVSLRPVLAALRAGKVVATANKETLVAGGHLVMPLARDLAARQTPGAPMASPLAWLRPIDSEHSAIWQCLVGEALDAVERLLLTASGGPFRTWSAAQLATATPRDALAHPTWDMGAKITIDSATLMNKGLEVIEAHWLYDVAYPRIETVVHPQSLVHSLVEFVDGSLKAQLGLPDMRIPIQYSLTWPRRVRREEPRLNLIDHPTMTFERPDPERFPALSIARDAGLAGPRATASLIAADEVAVRRFLDGTLSFPGIARLAAGAVERFGDGPDPELEEAIALDREVHAWAQAADVSTLGSVH
jgi:1-deoxy-D-xylulose-5-phosphate reductoisomerase